jgi:hypothetical protein
VAASPLWTSAWIVICCYVFALFGELPLGAEFAFLSILIFSVPGLVTSLTNPKERVPALKSVFSPAVFLFLGLVLIDKLTSAKITVSLWDEFSHWAQVIKELRGYHNLLGAQSAVGLKEYPPGSALFVYFFSRFFPEGSEEGILYFSQGLWIVSTCVFILRNLRWRILELVVALLTAILFYSSIIWLGYEPFSLYVDVTIALLFGAVLSGMSDHQSALSSLGLISAVVVALPLIKFSGSFFALFSTSLVALFFILREKIIWSRRNIGVLIFSLGIMGASWLAKSSWKQFYESEGIGLTFATRHIGLSNIIDSFSAAHSTLRDRVTIQGFGKALFAFKFNGFMTTASWFLVFLILSLASLFLAKKGKKHHAANEFRARSFLVGLLVLGFCFYAMGLLSLYLYTFGEYEGTHLSSFLRYLGTYLLGWCVFFNYLFFEDFANGHLRVLSKKWTSAGLAAVGVCLLPSASKITSMIQKPEVRFLQERLDVRDNYLYELRPFMKKPANYYLIWQQSGGMEMTVSRLELWPQKLMNNTCWSLGKPYYAEDFATCDISVEDFEKRLRHADYVFMVNADEQFWKGYGKLFDIYEEDKNCRLFKRVKRHDGHLQLIPIW